MSVTMNNNIDGATVPASVHNEKDIDSSAPGTPPLRTEDVEKIGSSAAVDKETEKRLLKKLDVRIIPMVWHVHSFHHSRRSELIVVCSWIYLMNFMDRVNIGNAKLYGLEDDLGMSGNQYQLAVSLLFVTYVVSSDVAFNMASSDLRTRYSRHPQI